MPCSLNGTHVLPNGTTIVVEANVVTSVTPKEETAPQLEEMRKANEELTNKLTEANAKIEELINKVTQFETLKNEFVEFKNKFSNHNPDSVSEPPIAVAAGNQDVEKRFKYSKK